MVPGNRRPRKAAVACPCPRAPSPQHGPGPLPCPGVGEDPWTGPAPFGDHLCLATGRGTRPGWGNTPSTVLPSGLGSCRGDGSAAPSSCMVLRVLLEALRVPMAIFACTPPRSMGCEGAFVPAPRPVRLSARRRVRSRWRWAAAAVGFVVVSPDRCAIYSDFFSCH